MCTLASRYTNEPFELHGYANSPYFNFLFPSGKAEKVLFVACLLSIAPQQILITVRVHRNPKKILVKKKSSGTLVRGVNS